MLCTWSETQFSSLMMFSSQRPMNMGRLQADTASTYGCNGGSSCRVACECRASACGFSRTIRSACSAGRRESRFAHARAAGDRSHLSAYLRFYAAHHKLHVFERFSKEAWPNCFLDLDVVLSRGGEAVQTILEIPVPWKRGSMTSPRRSFRPGPVRLCSGIWPD